MTSFNPDLSQPTCRVCLQNSNDEEMSSIFDVDGYFDDLHIYEKIEQCAGIKIIRHNNIPTLICGNCHESLKDSYKFRNICRNSNDYLKALVVIGNSSPLRPEESLPKENPQLKGKKTTKKKAKQTQYNTRLKEKNSSSPLLENIQSEHEFVIKNEAENASNSSSNDFDDLHGVEYLDEDDDQWLNPDYEDEDDDDVSIGSLELDVKVEAEKPEKITKKSTAKKKNGSNKPSKTLDISSDGAAIISEKKPREKRKKKEYQPHVCEICGNIYQRRYTLEMHMRRHGDKKEFECEICSDAFHSSFELNRHMRKHTGDKPYKCSYCSRAFGDNSTLTKHERIHRNERPYKCDTCGKSFTYYTVLKYHIYTHTGEKPYACEICGKSFIRKHHLRAHLETLQHQNDPRSKIQLANITENNICP